MFRLSNLRTLARKALVVEQERVRREELQHDVHGTDTEEALGAQLRALEKALVEAREAQHVERRSVLLPRFPPYTPTHPPTHPLNHRPPI